MATKARCFQLACRARLHSTTASPPQLHHPPAVSVSPAQPRRRHASSSSTPSGPSRRAISVTTDDGRYAWNELSTGEKAARSTQQTFNFALVAAGLAGTLTVAYLLYSELLAPDSHTVQFNAAVARVKASPECRALLGTSIRAFGEPTSNKWARARPLAHSSEVDRFGATQFRMRFNVEGSEGAGVVVVHMVGKPGAGSTLEYTLLSLSVKGHETVYLEGGPKAKEKVGKMFGVAWR